MTAPYRLHGLSCSYYTGKLEAYLRAKGIAHDFIEMDTDDFRACARATGIAQMPQLECPDGSWMTDTTPIIRHFEASHPGPALSPRDPATRFISLLLEDFGDEWLWRPAMYYRWQFADDNRLMSAILARTLMRDMRLPFRLRQWMIRRRQRRLFLGRDGVTAQTRPQIEALYHATLAGMERALADRPFLLGARPVEADFGFFASMFRHFSHEPTPAAIMRAEAPRVFEWVGRMWAATPEQLATQPLPEGLPAGLDGLMALIVGEYLPYLDANAAAHEAGEREVAYVQDGVSWQVPVNPYRVRCLAELQGAYQALDAKARAQVDALLGAGAQSLARPVITAPPVPQPGQAPLDHQMRSWAR